MSSNARFKLLPYDYELQHGEEPEEPAENLSTSSEEHQLQLVALSKPSRFRATNIPRMVATVAVFILWGVITFIAGIAIGKGERRGDWGSFENGFIEERVVSEFQHGQTLF